jgi:hypothetical protein
MYLRLISRLISAFKPFCIVIVAALFHISAYKRVVYRYLCSTTNLLPILLYRYRLSTTLLILLYRDSEKSILNILVNPLVHRCRENILNFFEQPSCTGMPRKHSEKLTIASEHFKAFFKSLPIDP